MATTTITKKTDDIDGTEATDTIHLGYEGVDYTIDLNEDNATRLDDILREFIAVAEKISPDKVDRPKRGRGKSAGAIGTQGPKIRKWAGENGFEVSPRGRIPVEIIDAYKAANPDANL